MNETIMRSLLRAAAWITIVGAVMGAVFQWTALLKGYASPDPVMRGQMRDAALTATVFWAILWVGLPLGVLSFHRFLGPAEKVLAFLLALVMVVGILFAVRL